jgi:peptidyl-prolyl isomerase E (cyclophilin E)
MSTTTATTTAAHLPIDYAYNEVIVKSKKLVYIGGIDQSVDKNALYTLCAPFGDIKNITLPLDVVTQRHRGFAFIEYETAEDAYHCIQNLHLSEIKQSNGKISVLQVHYAKPITAKMYAVWSQSKSGQEFIDDENDSAIDHSMNVTDQVNHGDDADNSNPFRQIEKEYT